MRVLKKAVAYRLKCTHCASHLEFEMCDILPDDKSRKVSNIICPVCKKRIYIETNCPWNDFDTEVVYEGDSEDTQRNK